MKTLLLASATAFALFAAAPKPAPDLNVLAQGGDAVKYASYGDAIRTADGGDAVKYASYGDAIRTADGGDAVHYASFGDAPNGRATV
jgi:hypothetical protein